MITILVYLIRNSRNSGTNCTHSTANRVPHGAHHLDNTHISKSLQLYIQLYSTTLKNFNLWTHVLFQGPGFILGSGSQARATFFCLGSKFRCLATYQTELSSRKISGVGPLYEVGSEWVRGPYPRPGSALGRSGICSGSTVGPPCEK